MHDDLFCIKNKDDLEESSDTNSSYILHQSADDSLA